MRTTVTLEPNVAERLKDYARRNRLSFKEALNTILRRGLGSQDSAAEELPPFIVKPAPTGFAPGVDPRRLNQLVDELDVDEFIRETRNLASRR